MMTVPWFPAGGSALPYKDAIQESLHKSACKINHVLQALLLTMKPNSKAEEQTLSKVMEPVT